MEKLLKFKMFMKKMCNSQNRIQIALANKQ